MIETSGKKERHKRGLSYLSWKREDIDDYVFNKVVAVNEHK